MPEEKLAPSTGPRGDRPVRPMAITQGQEVYTTKVEIVHLERAMANAPDSRSRYYLLKQVCFYLLALIEGLPRPTTPSSIKHYEEDLEKSRTIRSKVATDRVPAVPLPQYIPYPTEDPPIYEIVIDSDHVLSTVIQTDLIPVSRQLVFLRQEELYSEGTERLYGYWTDIHGILARQKAWGLDSEFHTTRTGYGREERRRSIESTTRWKAESQDDDDDDDGDDDPTG